MKTITDAIRTTEANIHMFQEMLENIEDTFVKTGFAESDNGGFVFRFNTDLVYAKRIHRRINNLKETRYIGLMTLDTTKELMDEFKHRSINPTRKVLTEKTKQPKDIPISYEELLSEREQEFLETAMHELYIILTSDKCHRREEETTDICSHILTLYECGLHYGHKKTIRKIERFVR
jgi:hypothetical protein